MRRRPALVTAAAVSLVLTACSGGDDDARSFGPQSSSPPSSSDSSDSSDSSAPPSASRAPVTTSSAAPSRSTTTPGANGLTTAQPTPGDKLVGLTCPAMIRTFNVVARRKKSGALTSGPIPAVTAKRESIGSLLEGLHGKLEASGTQSERDSKGKSVSYGYACYSGVTDIAAYLSLEGLGFFYEQKNPVDNRALLSRTVKLRKSKYIAPILIDMYFAGGLSNSEIDKNGNPGLGQTNLERRAKLVPLKGSVLVFWTIGR